MADTATVSIETDGGDQIVRLPDAFHLPGTAVRVTWSDGKLVLEPVKPSMSHEQMTALLDEIHRYADIPFKESGREQPENAGRR